MFSINNERFVKSIKEIYEKGENKKRGKDKDDAIWIIGGFV